MMTPEPDGRGRAPKRTGYDMPVKYESYRRYPGTVSFEDDSIYTRLFFGREKEAYDLLQAIVSETVTILHAPSGYGKTSLLKAAVFKKLRAIHHYPVVVRFNVDTDAPLSILKNKFREINGTPNYEFIGPDTPPAPHEPATRLLSFFEQSELWYHDATSDKLQTPVIVLDQFEELYTLDHNDPHRSQFLEELSELVRASKDGRLRVKVVISIREDMLARLESLSLLLPAIFSNRYALGALSREGARAAITGPASLDLQDTAITPPFSLAPEALSDILDFLCQRRDRLRIIATNEVAPIQLQIICQELEEIALSKSEAHRVIETGDLGGTSGLRKILTNFYDKQIAQLQSKINLPDDAVRKLTHMVESDLITNGRRVPIEYETLLARGIHKAGLDLLIENRLLKLENYGDNLLVEISHDTLVDPILEKRALNDARQKVENASNLYDQYLRQLQEQKGRARADVDAVRTLLEERLVADGRRVALPVLALDGANGAVREQVDALVQAGLLATVERDGQPFIEIANDVYLDSIVKAHKISAATRVAEEKEHENQRFKSKLNSYGLAAAVVALSIVAILVMRYRSQSRLNRQAPYAAAAAQTLYSNPTLSYIIANAGLEIDPQNAQLKGLIGSIERQHPIQLVGRIFTPLEITGVVLNRQNHLVAAAQSNLIDYSARPYYAVLSRTNDPVSSSFMNSRKGYFVRHTGGATDTAVVIDEQQQPVTAFLDDDSRDVIALSDDEQLLYAQGHLYRKGSLTPYAAIRTAPGLKDILCAAFIGNKYLALGYWSGTVVVYNTDGAIIKVFLGGALNSAANALAVTPDWRNLLSADRENNIYIWPLGNLDAEMPKTGVDPVVVPAKKLVGHQGAINAIAVSHDNNWILSGGNDRNAIVWNRDGQIKAVLRGHQRSIDFVQFAGNDSVLITASRSGEIFTWKEGSLPAMLRRGELSQFSRFEFRSVGLDSDRTPPNAVYPAEKDLGRMVMWVANSQGTLPQQNPYPEARSYNQALASSIAYLQQRYEAIFKDPSFGRLPRGMKRLVAISYARFVFKKPELLLQSYRESQAQAEDRQIRLDTAIINANLMDTTAFGNVEGHLNKLLAICFKNASDVDPARNEAVERYVLGCLDAYAAKWGDAILFRTLPYYVYLSDYYRQAGDGTKARQLLERGLASVANGDAAVKRQLQAKRASL